MITTGSAIKVRGLKKVYGEGHARVDALDGVDLDVDDGDFLAVMGPSGSGKSTLLHLIGGLARPTEGSLVVGGQDVLAMDDDSLTLFRRRHIGFVFQDFNILDVLTAEENVALPLLIDGVSEDVAHASARNVLAQVDLTGRANHLLAELSGGEQQRVAVARAMVTNPLIILADEPTGNLDSRHNDQIMSLLRRLADDQNQTIMMVTHESRNAALADRLITLRDGTVEDERALPKGRPPHDLLEDLGGGS
jgi:putative ABC transport system ATP-binding protein